MALAGIFEFILDFEWMKIVVLCKVVEFDLRACEGNVTRKKLTALQASEAKLQKYVVSLVEKYS